MKALYRFCMELDIYFKKEWADSSITQGKNTNKNIAVTYINKCGLPQFGGKTFADTTDIINIYEITDDELNDILILTAEKQKEDIVKQTKQKITPEMIQRWGSDVSYDDMMFLENRYDIMLQTYDDKNPANLWTYEEMCWNYLYLKNNRGNPQAQKLYQEAISKLQADCKMKIAQVDNSEDDDACLGMKIARIEQYEPCEKKLPFFDDIDGIHKYIKTWFVDSFAREWGIKGIEGLEDGDGEDNDNEE